MAPRRSVFAARRHNGIDVVPPVLRRRQRRTSLNVVAPRLRYVADDAAPDKCTMLLWPMVIVVVVAVVVGGALPKLECNSNCNRC